MKAGGGIAGKGAALVAKVRALLRVVSAPLWSHRHQYTELGQVSPKMPALPARDFYRPPQACRSACCTHTVHMCGQPRSR